MVPATHHGKGKYRWSIGNSPRIHSRDRFERRTTGEADRRGARLQAPPMVTARGWAIPAGKKPVWGFGKVEEMPRTVPARGIGVWWPEEGDRREGTTTARALGLRSALDEVRRMREMTSGPTSLQINIWAMPGGLSAVPSRTVREAGVTILPPKRNLAPRFNEWLKGRFRNWCVP